MLEGIEGAELNIVETASEVGGGSLPNQFIKSKAIEIDPKIYQLRSLKKDLESLKYRLLLGYTRTRFCLI